MSIRFKALLLIIIFILVTSPRSIAFFSRDIQDDSINEGIRSSNIVLQSAYSWTPTQVVSTVSNAQSLRPMIATDLENNVHVVWQDQTNYASSGGDNDIFYQLWNATTQTWEPTSVVSTESAGNSLAPWISSDEQGNLHVVWQDVSNYGGAGGDSDIFYKLWNRTTSSWGITEVVSTESGSNSLWPSISAYNGEAFVVWQDISNYGGAGSDVDIFYKQRFTNNSWSLTEVVSTESNVLSRFPHITLDADQNAHVVWDDGTNYNGAGLDEDIFYKYKNRTSGIWSTTEIISTESNNQSERSKIAIDIFGNRHIIWFDITDYSGAGTDRDIFYKRWNATLASWTLTEVVSTESTSSSEVPSIVVDVIGNVFCFWFDTTDLAGAGIDQDIFYKMWNATTKVWSPVEVVSIDSLDDSWRPNVAIDQSSKIHVIWQDRTAGYGGSGSDIDIFYSYGYIPALVMDLTIIQEPGDVSYEYSTMGNNLVWTIAGDNVSSPSFAVYNESIEILNQSWVAYTPIVVNIDGLDFGSYNYTLIATDGWGNFVYDTSNVSVVNLAPVIVSSPTIISYSVGRSGNTITWIVEDYSILIPTYNIFNDTAQIDTGNWSSGVPISIPIDGLSVGEFIFRIQLRDGYGGETQDLVRVHVTIPVNPLFELAPTFLLGVLVALGPVLISVIVKRRHRLFRW